VFLDQFSEKGGAQLCLRDLMPEIARRGWQSKLMTPATGLPLRPCANGRKTAWDFVRYSFDFPRMAAAIRRIVRDEHIDLIYVNGPRVLPAVIGARCPVIFHAHSRVDALYARKLIGCSLRSTHAPVIAVSEFIARDYPAARIISNGVPDLGLPGRGSDRRPVRVGIIGRIAPEKGQLDFVLAARQIPQAEFFVHGEPMFDDDAYDRTVRAMAQGAPIRFCGWTEDVGRALQDLDILVVPSGPNEAATRVIPEAFSAGTPVIAYRAGGIPEIIDHGRTGILTEAPDADALARAINRLIEDPGLRARMSAEARKEWSRRFTLERFQTAVCDLIADHATTHKRHAASAQASSDGAGTVAPAPTHPE
jgi:glycosyltransferase involved in cell wall biosynthesis